MNTEILKRNIEHVIMQPCVADPWNKSCTKIKANGLSEDGKYIMVKVEPSDIMWHCNLTEDYVKRIIEALPAKYQDHLVTLRHHDWISYSYVPVFDTDTQAEWDKEFEEFMETKSRWCREYGCD